MANRPTKLRAKRLVGRHGRVQRKLRRGASRAQRRLLKRLVYKETRPERHSTFAS